MSFDEGRASDAVPVAAGDVTVNYRPERDGDPDPGEVVWTWVPFEDEPQQGKDRPVIVIGVAGADLVVVGTHGRGAMYALVVGSVARRILTTVDADALVVRA